MEGEVIRWESVRCKSLRKAQKSSCRSKSLESLTV